MSITVITDSTAYLSFEIIDQYQIQVIPLNVHIPGEQFKEGSIYSNQEYYQILASSAIFPTTSQPSAGDFLDAFENLHPGDEALVILISSLLSGTVQSAQIACSMLETHDVRVTIIDSESAAMGLGFQVIKACEMLEAGKTSQEITDELKNIRKKLCVYFVVNNLEYLARGGRISKISSRIGNILQLKPVLALQNGELGLFDKVRTFPRAIKLILKELEKDQTHLEKICVIHVSALKDAQNLRQKLEAQYSVSISICEAGPVIGSHVGPGTLGLIYY